MIAFIRGRIVAKWPNSVTVLPREAGIGYEVVSPVDRHGSLVLNGEVDWHIWHYVSESTQRLFGFPDGNARQLALDVSDVHGIGPTLGHRLATSLSVSQLHALLTKGDDGASLAKTVKGLGPGKASALVAAMKGKLADVVAHGDPRLDQVIQGLRALGLPPVQPDRISRYLQQHPDFTVQTAIRLIASGQLPA